MPDIILPNLGLELPDVGSDQDTWGDILNANLEILDNAVTYDAITKTLGAVDVTLTTAEAAHGVINLDGTLTANVNLIVPVSPVRLYLVNNGTTGAFTVTVKTPLGTGITVLQGANSLVYSNGTNIVQGATSVGGTFSVANATLSGTLNVTGATTLAAASVTTLAASGAASFAAGTAALPSITRTGDLNTGIYFPAADTVGVTIGGAEALRIDSARNAALGVTPSAWVNRRALQLGVGAALAGSTADVTLNEISANQFSGSGGRTYLGTGAATLYVQSAGAHSWSTAPSGTAGAPITFTQAMTLTQSGNLLVGRTTELAGRLQLQGGAALGAGTGQPLYLYYNSATDHSVINTASNGEILFSLGLAGVTEAARITSARYFKASNTGSYGNIAGIGDQSSAQNHVFQSNANTDNLLIANSNAGSSVINTSSYLPSGSTGFHYRGFVNAVGVINILANGNVQNTNNSYGAISDAKLKTIIAARDGKHYWEKFKQIKFWIYSLINDPTNQQLLGVIAQELQTVFPGIVNSTPDMRTVTKTREITVTRQVTEPVQQNQTRTEIVMENGRYVKKPIVELITVDQPVFDEYPLYDEAGAVVMELASPEIPEERDEDGNVVTQGRAAEYRPAVHKVPRMETVTEIEEYQETEPTGEVTLSVNYSILGLIADTITQELIFRVEALEAK